MKFWKQQLTTKIASSFLLLSLLAVGVVGGVAFFSAKEALQQDALSKLSVAATLKEQEITRWFEEQQRDFLLITEFPDVRAKISKILENKTSESEYQAAYNILYQYLREVNKVKPNLQEISILDRTNRIIISTNKKRQGKYEPSANITYIEEIEQGNNFAPIFYVSPDTGKLTVTLARTWRNSAGVRQGVIFANLNLERIDEIVREKTGLGKSGESYLVGSLGSENIFISKEKAVGGESFEDLSSYGIDRAMFGMRGKGLYRNYEQVPVLGVYRWLNEQEFALLVEVGQREAFAPARRLANIIVILGLTSAGVLLVGVYWLSRQLEISRKQLEDYSHQLEVKAQEAETANQAKSEFLANMSHELRTPLNAILGFVQLMEQDEMLNSQQHNSLATINRSGEHLLALINDVLEMSKIEAGHTVVNSEAFNLHRLLQTLKEMFQLRATAKEIILEFDIDSNLPHFVVGDRGKLRQVLINLLSNAIKFTHRGGVTLRVMVKSWHRKYPGEKLCTLYFEVEDTGKGINPEELDQIFDPFVQAANRSQARDGTGLGLAISRQFIRLMGGEICTSSTLEKGSTFYFEIKLALAKRSKKDKSTKRQVIGLAPSQPSYRILVVDDRQENRDLLAELLGKVAFDVRTANNGIEAIEQWQEWQPHLIWMDMRMPLMDGYQATKEIKAQSQQYATVIIALTASAFQEQRAAILAAGCDELVHKPFQQEVIFETMKKYLGVEYLYKEEKEEQDLEEDADSDIEDEIKLTREDLRSVMSQEWIAKLHQAALEVDADSLLQIIEEIPETNKKLADKLRKLISQYDFDTIIELSKT